MLFLALITLLMSCSKNQFPVTVNGVFGEPDLTLIYELTGEKAYIYYLRAYYQVNFSFFIDEIPYEEINDRIEVGAVKINNNPYIRVDSPEKLDDRTYQIVFTD